MGGVAQNMSNYPDLSVFDFCLWGAMGQAAKAHTRKNLVDLETAVCTAWSQIDMEVARDAIRDSWPKILRRCSALADGSFTTS